MTAHDDRADRCVPRRRRLASVALVAVLVVGSAACSDDGDDAAGGGSSTTAPAATTSTASTGTSDTTDGASAPNPLALAEALASDDLAGRDNGTPGGDAARDLILAEVMQFAEPAYPDRAGPAGYLQEFDVQGTPATNILAVIPGGDLADEVVVVGGHYDHLGSDCFRSGDDQVCNGATDNAAGVAAAVAAARAVAGEGAPRRTILLALWDAEEDGLLGSAHYLSDPVFPLDAHVASVNHDILGANLLPGLDGFTIAIGAETGGTALEQATERAAADTPLDTRRLSLLFGQGRSDHAPFVNAGVPSVFFTDATNACYHTGGDDLDALDGGKLAAQIATSIAILGDLASTDDPPDFVADAPVATYADAETMLALVSAGEPDLDLLSDADQRTALDFKAELQAMVDAGPDAFGDEDVSVLLAGSADLVAALAGGDCEALLAAG